MGISVAITKGRLEKESVKILENGGFGVDCLKNKGRKLVFKDNIEDVEYFLVKARDTITYVEHGVADIGIVGSDTLVENKHSCYEVMDLEVGKCKFIVGAKEGVSIFNRQGHIKIGTKYPSVAKEFFKTKNMDVEIIKIEGSVELGPILGLCDAIVDIMETGITLKENGLVVLEDIFDISARIIVNKVSLKLKKDEINTFLKKVENSISNK